MKTLRHLAFFILSLLITAAVPTVNAAPFSSTGSMSIGRKSSTLTLLPNGKVLVVGGYTIQDDTTAQSSSELYDPSNGTWTLTGALSVARARHTATLLPNGKVLVCGGMDVNANAVASVELYDPVSGTWSTQNPMISARAIHTASLLPNGKVLLSGGFGFPVRDPIKLCELYDPTTGAWSSTGQMTSIRKHHTNTLLQNGRVLVSGGADANNIFLSSCEIYNPATGAWVTTGSLALGRSGHEAVLLATGEVLVATGEGNNSTYLTQVELFNPTTDTWSLTGALAHGRSASAIGLLGNGTVLATGGGNPQDGSLSSAELYNRATGQWTSSGTMVSARTNHSVALLGNGKLLIAGGKIGNNPSLNSAELYTPIIFTAQPQPQTLNQGQATSFSVTATGNGTLSYQWQKDGVDIPNATGSTYNIASAQPQNIGYYTCKVTDSVGTVTSQQAALNINDVPFGVWQGLVGHYLFNAYSSPDETGLTGNLVEAGQSIFPGPDRITGQSINGQSGSVRFLGTSDGLKTQTDFSTPESLTVSVWFKADSAAEGRIIESSWGEGPWIIVYRNNAMHVGLLSQTQQFIFESAQVSLGWHCAGFAFDESTRIGRVYLDGIEVGSLQLDTPLRPSVSPCPLWIGGREQTSERFEGYVDDVRIYNRALSATEVGQLYTAESNKVPVVSLVGSNPLTFEAAASYTDPGATATDVENGMRTPSITSNTVVPNVPGTYAVTWSATDSVGATGSATRVVNVVDTTAPVVAAHGNVTVEATSAAGATVTYAAGSASDAVGVTSITYSQNSGTVFPIGTTTVTITARDAANNAGTGTFTVTVRDTTAPVVAAHGNVTVEATSAVGATVTYAAGSATDAVGVTSQTYSQNSGTVFPIGTTTVTITAKDAANNTGTGTFTVTVNKLPQSISFSAPATARSTDVITLEATGGESGNTVTFSVFSGPGSLAGDVLTFSGAGTVVVRAIQSGDANYEAAANVDQTITVALNHAPVAVDDAVTTTTGDTTLYPLANDTDAEGDLLSIASVSGVGVTISADGRGLTIPLGTPSFTYTVTDGSVTDTGAVTVSAGTAVVGATTWTGLLYDANGDIAGVIRAIKARTGRFTAALRMGTVASAVSFLLDADGEATATISLGTLNVTKEGSTERLAVSLVRGADTFSGSLRPSQITATPVQHNIALASVDAAVPGGGYARAFVKANGIVVVKGFLPDGRSFTNSTRLADNGSFVIYALAATTKPAAIVGGEFITANLTSTDVTGELAWVKGTQTRGLHAAGVDTTLTANGCIYTPADTLPGGSVTVTVSGGNLAAPLSMNTTATAGVPVPSVAFPSWKVVSIRGVSTGTFSARVKNPANTRTVGATGVYLPKSNSAWGYFPGTTVGGRIQLTQP